jgi:1-aminocyclopropane-1-carboxylate deaminase/D-cysteine desulfhydrase-like pyridoxal-dependent ACC family enzyme
LISYNPIINSIDYNGYQIGVLRLDEIHPEISGNKWFKLKDNLSKALLENKKTILTFGGAYSNHIAATAMTCKLASLKSIGIIRGESTSSTNSTLTLAKENGMQLIFVSREQYKQKDDPSQLQLLQAEYPDAYIIPEGGDNALGQKGCEEILSNISTDYDLIFCAHGTGTTFRGIAKSLLPHQKLIGINVLKYEATHNALNATVNNQYHFGGYAKHNNELLEFKSWFETTYHIPLDYVYTSKLMYALFDLIKQQQIYKGKKILIIHSGGLQGNKGYEERYKLKLA